MLYNIAITDMALGDEIEGYYLLSAASQRTTNGGKPYLTGTISDRSGSMELVVWDFPGGIGPEDSGKVVKLRGKVSEYRGGRQFSAQRIRLADQNDRYELSELVPIAPIDLDAALAGIEALIATLTDDDYRRMAEEMLRRHRERFVRIPAAKSVHHGFLGGLLMHTANMLYTADFLAGQYAEVVNRSLLLCGTLLHDLAKEREFDFSPLGLAVDYSLEGQLLGHLVMGAREAARTAEELGLPQEKAVLLQHLILSHHGEPEFGAAVRPMCAEAELLHLIDMIDSRMEIYAETFQSMPAGSLSGKIFALDRKIYKPTDRETE